MNYFDAVKAGFLDELQKIAEDGETKKKPQKLTGGQKALALLAGGPGGYFGAMKAAPHGEALEGGIRGALGSGIGGMAGSQALGAIGQRLGGMGSPQHLLGALAGNIGGQYGGYKLLTNKYEPVEG